MLVTSSFHPARPDELSLRMGETLRLVREFEDEWCLVQRVGRPNAEKGVVPRFCLEERARIIKNRATVAGLAVVNGARRK
jgi:Variant SH3 domain